MNAGQASLVADAIAAKDDGERFAALVEESAERHRRAVLAMSATMSLAEIGQALGVSRQRAHALVKAARSQASETWGTVTHVHREDRRDSFAAVCEAGYLAAEERTRGVMVAPRYRDRYDGRDFYLPHGRRAPKVAASEELREHWLEVGQPLGWNDYRRVEREVA